MTNELDGEAVLFDAVTGSTYRLNETALEVWRQCDGRTNTRTIANRILDVYEVDLDTAPEHVQQVIVLFLEAGLLEAAE